MSGLNFDFLPHPQVVAATLHAGLLSVQDCLTLGHALDGYPKLTVTLNPKP